MLATVKGQLRPSCILLPAEGRGSATWTVEPLDKLGYRGVESAAWRFEGHHAPRAEILGGEAGQGQGARQMLDVLAVGRVNVACRALGSSTARWSARSTRPRSVGSAAACSATIPTPSCASARCAAASSWSRPRSAAPRTAIDAGEADAAEWATAAKTMASESAVWAVELASRLAASRSYTGGSELTRLRRDAPQTQIGEGANDALLIAAGKTAIKRHGAVSGRGGR